MHLLDSLLHWKRYWSWKSNHYFNYLSCTHDRNNNNNEIMIVKWEKYLRSIVMYTLMNLKTEISLQYSKHSLVFFFFYYICDEMAVSEIKVSILE